MISFMLLFALMIGHALADYPLQNDFLAKAKNRLTPVPGITWWVALFNHALIHAGFVWLFTGSFFLALFEVVLHMWIDDAKCRTKITFNEDQILHLVCKIDYVAFLYFVPDMGRPFFGHFG